MRQIIEVKLGCPPGQRKKVTEIYTHSFAEKLKPFLGSIDRAAAFLERGFCDDRALVATCDGKVAGVAGFKRDGRGLFEPGTRAFFREYGLSAPFRLAGLLFVERPTEPGCLLMDGIAVDPDMRGMGIGTRLLEAIEQHARELGDTSTRLDVVDTNAGARKLYERFGFVPVKTRSVGILAPLFSFKSATEMRKDLP